MGPGELRIAMAEVIALPFSPLRPYHGVWRIDPLCKGRRRKAYSPLADPDFALLWKCGSIADRQDALADDAALAARYAALSANHQDVMEVTPGRLVFTWARGEAEPRESNLPIVKVTAEDARSSPR